MRYLTTCTDQIFATDSSYSRARLRSFLDSTLPVFSRVVSESEETVRLVIEQARLQGPWDDEEDYDREAILRLTPCLSPSSLRAILSFAIFAFSVESTSGRSNKGAVWYRQVLFSSHDLSSGYRFDWIHTVLGAGEVPEGGRLLQPLRR